MHNATRFSFRIAHITDAIKQSSLSLITRYIHFVSRSNMILICQFQIELLSFFSSIHLWSPTMSLPEIAAVANESRFNACQNSALYNITCLVASRGTNFGYILYELCTLYEASMVNWRYLRKSNGTPILAPLIAITAPQQSTFRYAKLYNSYSCKIRKFHSLRSPWLVDMSVHSGVSHFRQFTS